MWQNDPQFIVWLDEEGLGTDENPLDDDTLDLMFQAWRAGRLRLAAQNKEDNPPPNHRSITTDSLVIKEWDSKGIRHFLIETEQDIDLLVLIQNDFHSVRPSRLVLQLYPGSVDFGKMEFLRHSNPIQQGPPFFVQVEHHRKATGNSTFGIARLLENPTIESIIIKDKEGSTSYWPVRKVN